MKQQLHRSAPFMMGDSSLTKQKREYQEFLLKFHKMSQAEVPRNACMSCM